MFTENDFRKFVAEELTPLRYSEWNETRKYAACCIDRFTEWSMNRNDHDCTIEWIKSFHRKKGFI